jgi:hypothetical protein
VKNSLKGTVATRLTAVAARHLFAARIADG